MTNSSKKKTILVFTGGGLAPALNATLHGVITSAQAHGHRILGGILGWRSLLEGGKIIDLTKFDVRPIRRTGGTFLKSSRANPHAEENGIEQVKKRIKQENIDVIVAIGGDDTLGAAEKLYQEHGIPVVGIPKTIDNDLPGTYWTPGHPTAAQTLANLVHEIRFDAAYPLQRVFLVESYGMNAGWMAASAAYGLADMIIPPEKEVNMNHFIKTFQKRIDDNGDYGVIVLSEHAQFSDGVEGESFTEGEDTYQRARRHLAAVGLRKVLKKECGMDMRLILPGNFVQTGPPSDIDGDVAEQLGNQAIDMINQGLFGHMSCVVRPNPNTLTISAGTIPLSEAVGKNEVKILKDDMFDFDNFQVKQAYLDYMEPILGKWKKPDHDYAQLLDSLN